MKRVAILKSNASAKGGLELYTRKLATAFAERGDEVILLTTGQLEEMPFEVVSLCDTTKFSLHHIQRFDGKAQKWLRENKPDVIFGMERTSFQTHYRAGSGVHAAYLKRRSNQESWFKQLSFRINPLHRTILGLEKRAFEHPDLQRLFVNSRMVREEISELFDINLKKLAIVHNGVDWEAAHATAPNLDQFHFLFVGNDYKRKGLGWLLRALVGLDNYKLTVVGRDKNEATFRRLAEKLKINAHFAGLQRDLYPFYLAADCLVLPTIYDPFANVTLEALAHGLFVITSPMNGGKEILKPYSGLVVEPEELKGALFKARYSTRDPERIRNSVKHLTFENQLREIVDQC